MGVYVFQSKHHNVIKIGSHIGSNAWGRVINKGFFSVIRPAEITDKVDVTDLELLYWFPSLTVTEEHLLQYKLREFRVIGEWFTLAALEKIPTYVTLRNRSDTCVVPVCSLRPCVSPTLPVFTKVLDLTMETAGDTMEIIAMSEPVKPPKLVDKKKSKKISQKVIYRTINTLTSDEILQCINLMGKCCEECTRTVVYSLRKWEDKQVCLGCLTELTQKKYDHINAYLHKKGNHECSYCRKPRTDYHAFSKDGVNIWSKGQLLAFPQYARMSVDQIINIIDNGVLVCLPCYTVIVHFEYKYGYRKMDSSDPCKDSHDYDAIMAPVFEQLRAGAAVGHVEEGAGVGVTPDILSS
jgi:hypothetical protein